MKLKNNGKLNFIIYIHTTFGEALTGGLMVLHYLAYVLAKKGYNVYIFCKTPYPHENIHKIKSFKFTENGLTKRGWEQFTYHTDNTVSIYPEGIKGNPFNTKHVARWILYDTKKDIEETYGENDVYFNYGNFRTYKNVNLRQLTVHNFHFDILKNKNLKNRKGFCHLLHKNTNENSKIFVNELNSKDLSGWKTKGAMKYLADEFNKHEYFVTYDEKSFFTVAAAMCGCKAIICNPKNNSNIKEHNFNNVKLSPFEYRLKNPTQMYGISYGFNDISWSEKTIDLVENQLRDIEKMNDKTVDDFIKFWENK